MSDGSSDKAGRRGNPKREAMGADPRVEKVN